MTPWFSTRRPTRTPAPPAPAWFGRLRTAWLIGALALAGGLLPAGAAQAASPADLLAGYTAQAGSPASAARGQQFFNTRQGREWRCASCHGALPTQAGQHASTGKAISALAPAFNPERFTDPAKVEKWFRRNCNDVAARECSAAEKADVLAWLLTLKP
jgi:mono/diheme cytochrome c family protein